MLSIARIVLVLCLVGVVGACTAAKPNLSDGGEPRLDGSVGDSGSDARVDSGAGADDGSAGDAGDSVDAGSEDGGLVCLPDTEDCDRDVRNGCEADLTSDASCGACEIQCTGGRICLGRMCRSATIVGIAAGGGHSCALLSTGDLSCWGDDSMGQLGDCVVGSPDRHEPMPVRDFGGAAITDAVAVAAFGSTTCATRGLERRIDCWGNNSPNRYGPAVGAISVYGCPEPQLFSDTPVPSDALRIAGTHHCALTGTVVRCAGANAAHQLGRTSSTTTLLGPVVGLPASSPVDVAIGGASSGFSLVALADGSVYSFGTNTNAECAQPGGGSIDPPTVIAALANIVQVAAGVNFACALDDVGAVRCWGSNDAGQTGTGVAGAADVSTPTLVSGTSLPVFEEIVAGRDFVFALVAGRHEVWGWGSNNGQFGLGPAMLDDLVVPTQLLVDPSSTYDVAAGSMHALLVRHRTAMPDELLCAGTNSQGQCGQTAGAPITTYQVVPSFP